MSNKFCLGTVQFGLNYGIKNELGRQPSEKESFGVLKAAIESGISYFDTASAYGNAEQVLGDFGIGKYPVHVISKLKPDLQEPLQDNVLLEIRYSLKRLGLSSLYGYMLHRAEDFYKPEIMAGLAQAKELGLIQHIGVSVYEPEDALRVVTDPRIDCVQIPYSVFDQRLDQTDFFELAEQNRVRVFARSAFLQGLLLMESKDVPLNLREAKPLLIKFDEIISQFGFSRTEAAVLFSYQHRGIANMVFGVDTATQLLEDLRIISLSGTFDACRKELSVAFDNVPRKILMPNLW